MTEVAQVLFKLRSRCMDQITFDKIKYPKNHRGIVSQNLSDSICCCGLVGNKSSKNTDDRV